MYQSLNKRKILSVCIAASLLSHLISIIFLQKHAFWTASPPASLTASLTNMDRVESDKILKESFQDSCVQENKKSCSQKPQLEASAITLLPLFLPIEPPPASVLSFSPMSLKYEFAAEILKPSFSLPPVESFNIFEHLPKDLILPSASRVGTVERIPSLLPKTPLGSISPPVPKRAAPTHINSTVAFNPSFSRESDPAFPTPSPRTFSQLPEFPSLEDLGTSSYSDSFDTEIVFSPLENGEGYIFALTLVPQSGFTLPKLSQRYSFLIDCSNSIQKERLSTVKTAVLKALEELDLEDSFNIIAFDSKIEKFSPAPVPATSSSFKRAREFLDQVQLGSFFSTTNISKPLLLTIPAGSQDDGLHTAILFSDGESLNKKMAQRELALDWTRYNNGRVSLFSIGVGGDPHLATLDAAAAFNRGKILYPPTKKGIRRKLLKLMKTIGHPIAKDIIATAIPRSSQTKITLYPKPQQMPALYQNDPYVILGTIDKLDNFILFIQGKIKNQWLNIRKNITFINAKKRDASLNAEWALQQAYSLYEQYLYDLNPASLIEARDLLAPYDLQVAFQ